MPSRKPKTSTRSKRRVYSTGSSSSEESSGEEKRRSRRNSRKTRNKSSSSDSSSNRSSSDERAKEKRRVRLGRLRGIIQGDRFEELKRQERNRRSADYKSHNFPAQQRQPSAKSRQSSASRQRTQSASKGHSVAAAGGVDLTAALSNIENDINGGKKKNPGGNNGDSSDAVELKSPNGIPQCPNCDEENEKFSGENMKIHFGYWCPATAFCKYCNKMIEMRHVNKHRKELCPQLEGKFFVCEKCGTPGEKEDIDKHDKIKGFCPGKPPRDGYGRCNLCRKEVEDDKESWKTHLIGVDGCKKNPKRLLSGLGHTG